MRYELFVLLAGVAASASALTVVETRGNISIRRGDEVVVDAVVADRGRLEEADVRRSFTTRTDGTKVWNRWSETRDRRFRLEVAEYRDGSVEISMAAQVEPDSTNRLRQLVLHLPENVLEGKSFDVVTGRGTQYAPTSGTMGKSFDKSLLRWLSANGLTFDFNPLGPADSFGCAGPGEGWAHIDAVSGHASLTADDTGWKIVQGGMIRASSGGYQGMKIVVREGVCSDYDRFHPARTYGYARRMDAVKAVAFGSPVRGKGYAEGDVLYSGSRGYGWDEILPTRTHADVVGWKEGVFYSALTETGAMRYLFTGLTDGWYLFSFAAGNYSGATNRYSVTVGERPIMTDESVPKGMLRRITLPVHVASGRLEVCFSGTWLVSTMALQPVLSDAEDFGINRRFWCMDGYEPGALYRNDDNPEPFKPGFSDTLEVLPTPGTEFAGPCRELELQVELPDPNRPELAWTRNARIQRVGSNSSTFTEYPTDEILERYLDAEVAAKGTTAVMLSGMLSRHTYARSLFESAPSNIARIVAALHRRGIKVIDHVDATLLWNVGGGYRVLMRDVDLLLRGTADFLPSTHYCVNNPVFRERLYAYLRRQARLGVDAFQVDEVYLWYHGCTCCACQERFFRDTGWRMPMNECDAAWQNADSEFRRVWSRWRVKCCTDFFVELRRRLKDVNDHLVLSSYVTPDGFMTPWPYRLGQSLEDLSRAVNFFGNEVMSRCVLRTIRAELPLRRAANILAFQYGAPIWDWYYNFDWQNDYAAWAMSEMAAHTSLLSEVAKTDVTPDYVAFGKSGLSMRRDGARPVAEVGLWFSSRSRDEGVGDSWRKTLFGVAQELELLHVPYEFVPDGLTDERRLGKYKVLFVLGLSRRTPREEKIFTDYERGGGRLVSEVAGAADFCAPLASPPEVWSFKPDPVRERRWRKQLSDLVAEASWWRIEAPDDVRTSVWREPSGELAIHFLNASDTAPKPGERLVFEAPDSAFAPLESDVRFVVPEGASAVAISPDFEGERPLAATREACGRLAVTLPKELLKTYTLVRIRK